MTRRLALPVLFAILAAPVLVVTAQVPRDSAPVRTGDSVLAGTVISEPDGRPLRHAIVSLSGSGLQPGRSTTTDEAGAFSFAALPAGNVTLTAHKPAYVQAIYGQKRPGKGPGVLLSLAAGQRMDDIVVRVPRGAVVTGTIRDESGAPRRGLTVVIQGVRLVNGERRASDPRSVSREATRPTTDDRGVFRAYGLPEGEYIVSASLPSLADLGPRADLRRVSPTELQWANGQLRGAGPAGAGTGVPGSRPSAPPPPPGPRIGAATVYFPGTTNASAAVPVTVGVGEERAGVDFVVGYVPTARLNGTVVGAEGQPTAGVQVTVLQALAPIGGPATALTARSGSDGAFSIANLPPGTHRLFASIWTTPGRGANPTNASMNFWASADVSVNGEDVNGLALTLQQGMKLRGHLVFDGGTPAPALDPSTVRVLMAAERREGPSAGRILGSSPAADGTFEFAGLLPGRYWLTASVTDAVRRAESETWTLKSATIGGRDAADVPFEVPPGGVLSDAVVTLSDRVGEISGTLLDATGRPTAHYFVVVFSTDRQYWIEGSRRIRPPVRPASNGTFRFSPLPAGTYHLAALTDVDQEDLYDREFLEQVAAGAITITLGDGEKRVQDVKLAGR